MIWQLFARFTEHAFDLGQRRAVNERTRLGYCLSQRLDTSSLRRHPPELTERSGKFMSSYNAQTHFTIRYISEVILLSRIT
jgi:hypothetical protein